MYAGAVVVAVVVRRGHMDSSLVVSRSPINACEIQMSLVFIAV
jgi:hypothetical protein